VVVGWWVDAPCPEDDVDLRLVFRVGVAGGEVRRDGPPFVVDEPRDLLDGFTARHATLCSDRALVQREWHPVMARAPYGAPNRSPAKLAVTCIADAEPRVTPSCWRLPQTHQHDPEHRSISFGGSSTRG
jgi:hypothetical protein